MSTTPATLPISLNVEVNKEPREVFMSFALLNRLTILIGDMSELGQVMLDPAMRATILEELLAERTPAGKLVKTTALDEMEISLSDIMALIDFASDHLLDFFVTGLKRMEARTNKYNPQLPKA